MSNTPKIEYRGYDIWFNENMDEWSVHGLNYSNKSLKLCRDHIDRLYLKMRKENSVQVYALCVPHSSKSSEEVYFETGTMIDYIREVTERERFSNDKGPVVDHRVAVVSQRRDSTKPARREEKMSHLVKPGHEAEAALVRIKAARAAVLQAQAAFDAEVESLPRFTLDDIAMLVKASKASPTES